MSTIQYSFQKPIPDSVTFEKAIAHLHDPLNLITINPIVVKYQQISPPADAALQPGVKQYELHDEITYLPFGLWKGSKTVHVTYTDREDGVTVVKQAPFGFLFQEMWTVRLAQSGLEVDVQVEMSGWQVGVLAFKSYMQKNHRTYLDLVVEGMGKSTEVRCT